MWQGPEGPEGMSGKNGKRGEPGSDGEMGDRGGQVRFCVNFYYYIIMFSKAFLIFFKPYNFKIDKYIINLFLL